MRKLSSFRFVVADDNVFFLKLISEILKTFNVPEEQIHKAESGRSAVKLIKKTPVDIIITGALMQPIDGFKLTKLVRIFGEDKVRRTPIIMCTSYTDIDNVIKARDFGVTEVIAKPISVKKLRDRILHVINNPRPFVDGDRFNGPCRRRKEKNCQREAMQY